MAEAELQSKLAGLWAPPGPVADLVRRELARPDLPRPDLPQLDTPRHTITVDDVPFRKRLRKQLARSRPAPARA